ncbi:MAG TPA: trypsin-like serine protease [Kofleriaceae bacterium]|jgi:endonuclease G
MKKLLWSSLLLAGSFTSVAAGPAPIVGGTQAQQGEWPDAVALLGHQGTCSGTLIAPNVILTAGHCKAEDLYEAVLDTNNFKGGGGIVAEVQSVTEYPNWETSYDVSVVVLTAPVQGVTPRKIASDCTFQTGWMNGAMVHLVGFGATDLNAEDANTTLREVSVPLTDATCANGNGCEDSIKPNGEFTAGGSGIDSCNGDSGGPVYLETPHGAVLVGAVSRSVNAAATLCGDGGIYVRADKIAAWVEQTTGAYLERDTCSSGGDNTGDDDGMKSDDGGGCDASGQGSGSLVVIGALAVVIALRRRS